MEEPWIAAQMVIGSEERATRDRTGLVRSILHAVARARDLAHLDALILWPHPDADLNREIARGCRSEGVAPLLWFPLLSDAPGVPQPPECLVMSCDDARGHGRSGAWEGLSGGEERFLFSCPNDARYLDSLFTSFERLLGQSDADGVMLDRIRFPGPSNGFESLLGCFCPACAARFESETGGSLAALKEKAGALLRMLHDRGPVSFLAAWKETGSFWAASGLEELAGHRARSILAVVQRFSSVAKARGLSVGLDLYSPSLAPLVGQDYAGLSGLCDWMKPMLYCRAVGPAGLPLEIACLWKAFRALHAPTDPNLIRAGLREVLGWKLPATEAELLAHGLPARVISSELAVMGGLRMKQGVRVYAGIEAVRLPFFGIDITADGLRTSLAEVRPPAVGVIASWNLLHIPEDNQRALGAWGCGAGSVTKDGARS